MLFAEFSMLLYLIHPQINSEKIVIYFYFNSSPAFFLNRYFPSLFSEIPKNEYNKNQSMGNSPIKVELQNNMDR